MTEGPEDPEFFRAIVEGLGEGVVLVDAQGGILWASRSLELATGHDQTDHIGRSILGLMHPEDAEKALVRQSIGSDWRSWRAVRRIRLADGGYRAYDCTTTDLTGSGAGGYVVVLRGVDEQHTWEAEHRLRALVEHSADAVMILATEPGS